MKCDCNHRKRWIETTWNALIWYFRAKRSVNHRTAWNDQNLTSFFIFSSGSYRHCFALFGLGFVGFCWVLLGFVCSNARICLFFVWCLGLAVFPVLLRGLFCSNESFDTFLIWFANWDRPLTAWPGPAQLRSARLGLVTPFASNTSSSFQSTRKCSQVVVGKKGKWLLIAG